MDFYGKDIRLIKLILHPFVCNLPKWKGRTKWNLPCFSFRPFIFPLLIYHRVLCVFPHAFAFNHNHNLIRAPVANRNFLVRPRDRSLIVFVITSREPAATFPERGRGTGETFTKNFLFEFWQGKEGGSDQNGEKRAYRDVNFNNGRTGRYTGNSKNKFTELPIFLLSHRKNLYDSTRAAPLSRIPDTYLLLVDSKGRTSEVHFADVI